MTERPNVEEQAPLSTDQAKRVAAFVVKELRDMLSCVPCNGLGFGYLDACSVCKGRGHVREPVKRLIAANLTLKGELERRRLAIERRDARIAELEGIPATEIETRDPDKLLAIIRGMDVECVGAMDEAKRAREERNAIHKALRCDPNSDAVSLAETIAKRAALCDAAEEERDAALVRVGELEAEVSNLWDSLDIAVKRHDTELFTAHANGIEAAAKHVEAHSCVSSCCDANPSSAEARALAACIRSGAPRNGPLVRVATGGEIVRAGTGETA